MKIDAKKLLSKILLAFVLVSIGFAIGKEATLRRVPSGGDAASAAGQGEKVIVYYMHATIRCVTCNSIEAMAARLVDTTFAEAKQAGRLVWKEVDFQQNENLAKRYDVVSSCLVIVHVQDGKEVDFKRLDDVWLLDGKPQEFNDYVAGAITGYLEGGPKE